MLIPHPLLATKLARPHHPVLVTDEREWTAFELTQAVEQRAAAYRDHGIQRGQVVAVRGPVGADLVIAIHAIGWLGAVAYPLSHKDPLPDLEQPLRLCEHRVGDFPGAIPLDPGEGGRCPAAEWSLFDTRLIVGTSGTMGRRTDIPLNAMQLALSAFGSAIRIGHLPTDRWINPLPLNHVGGLSILYRCAWYGTTVELHDRFDAAKVSASLDDKGSIVSLVPVTLERVLDHRNDAPFAAHVRCIMVGGAATPGPLLDRCRRIQAPISLTWGMTEAASQVATRYPGDLDEDGAPPLPFATVKADDQGVLSVHGPLVKGSRQTGDRGFIADSGRIVVTGRKDNVIISGGENIDPSEIERCLIQHPNISAVAVVGVPSELWGARPIAFIEGRPVEDDALKVWCRAQLARYKVPAAFSWMEALPRNQLGKILKRKLAEEWTAERGKA